MSEPLVTVIVPTYNYAHYLGQTLETIFAQTYERMEVLVIDDASPDHPETVVEKFDDARLRLIRHESNKGVAASRNTGIAEAAGKHVALFDADDLMAPRNIEKKVQALEASGGKLGFVYGNARLIDPEGTPLRSAYAPDDPRLRGDMPLFDKLLESNVIIMSSVVATRESLVRSGPYDESLRYTEDWEMWLRVSRGYDAAYLPEALVDHRLHPKSSRQTHFRENLDLELMKKMITGVFEDLDLERAGYSFESVYWSNYFRMLHNKVGLMPSRRK